MEWKNRKQQRTEVGSQMINIVNIFTIFFKYDNHNMYVGNLFKLLKYVIFILVKW